MSKIIGGIIDYEPEPENPETKQNILWIVAAISLSMAALGYIIIVAKIF